MEPNLLLIIVIAIIMMVLYGFLDALRLQMQTGVWDIGYLAATFIYSLIVGLIGGFSGLLDLSMPFEQWLPVLMTVWGQYFLYMTILHTIADYLISKLFPSTPQGLASPFLKERTKQMLALARP